jgi:glycosyltransferase involved in cell wall biosynthesis
MKKIRILQIIKGLDIGGDSGGAELFGVKLAQELNKNEQVKVIICAFYSVGTKTEIEWLHRLNQEGIQTFFVSEWGGINNLRKFLKGMIKLIHIFQKDKLDISHSHFQLGTFAAVLLKFLGISKFSYRTAHIRKEWDNGKWTWFLNPIFIRWIFPKYLNGEIGVSKAVVDYLKGRKIHNLDEGKIHLIYNGINIHKIIESCNEIEKIEIPETIPKPLLIGSVGRLSEQKGYPYLIEAMKLVTTKINHVKLFIVGDGELREELLGLTKLLNLTDYVSFLGLKDNVPSILKNFDLFVLSSLWEGLPTVVMEAMVCSVPVIATNIPGTRELIEDGKTGFLVEPQNIDGLANKVIEVLENETLRIFISVNAFKEVQNYDMKEIGNKYLKLFLGGGYIST